METNISVCPTCNQSLPLQPKKRGRPKVVEDYKERKKEYNKRYYDKLRDKLKNEIIEDNITT
jgi:ribosomal protein L34E